MDGQQRSGTPFTTYVDSSFEPGSFPATPGSKPGPTPEDLDKAIRSGDRKWIKKCLRTLTWPANHKGRADLWFRVLVLVEPQETSIYTEMVKSVFGEGRRSVLVSLPSFVDPANMYHYHLSEQGVHVAKRIICVIGTTNPDVTFAPTIFPVVCLFLHYMSEEQCYNCVYSLLKSKHNYLIQTKLAHETSKFVLKTLAKKYARACFNYISKQGLAVEGVLETWLNWILCDLPFQHLMRVVDCYLYEGPKVLYRVALAILILFHKQRSSKGSGLGVAAAIKQFCEDMPVPSDKLLKTAFGIRGLSWKVMQKAIVRCEMYVRSMRHVSSLPHMTKSASCESLNLKVSRSFSGPTVLSPGSTLVGSDEADSIGAPRARSQSHGVLPFSGISSGIVTFNDWHTIWSWLPARITLMQPVLLYTTAEHGTSLSMFYNCVDDHEPTLLVLKNEKNEVAGAYCSVDWLGRRALKKFGFFGSGETFLFKLAPQKCRYEWVGTKLKDQTPNNAHLFMAGNDKKIAIGGGCGEGLQLDEELLNGRSENCATFNNDPLFNGGDFQCMAVEVFGFR